MLMCAIGLWPMDTHTIDIQTENHKKYKNINTYRTSMIEIYNECLKSNERKITLRKDFPLQSATFFSCIGFILLLLILAARKHPIVVYNWFF